MATPLSPKVSVCIPVYNGSEYISDTIRSILSQTFDDFEIIVCDNCSTDNTGEIVRSFDDSRIRYICNEKNLGIVGNPNRAIDLSRGEYVHIIHHDDVMMPENLACKVRILDEHPHVGFVHSNIKLFDQSGKIFADNIWCEDSRRDYIENGLEVFKRYLEYLPNGASIFIGSVLARKACYEKVGGFNPALPHCQDSHMWMRMMLFYDVACIGTPLVKYRVHLTSASSSWGIHTSLPYFREHFLAFNLLFENYGNHIPGADSLKRLSSQRFSEKSVSLARKALNRGDANTCRAFLSESIKISPRILAKVEFWKTALRMVISRAN